MSITFIFLFVSQPTISLIIPCDKQSAEITRSFESMINLRSGVVLYLMG